MQTAWRERNPPARIKAAKEAITLNPECATAYILLAEDATPMELQASPKADDNGRIRTVRLRIRQQLPTHHCDVGAAPS